MPGLCEGPVSSRNFKCAYRKCAFEALRGVEESIGLSPYPGQDCQRRNFSGNIADGASLNDLSNKFCEFRDQGVFGYSVICRVFVVCSRGENGEPIATFRACKEGMNFDSFNGVCVDASEFNCFIGPSKYVIEEI